MPPDASVPEHWLADMVGKLPSDPVLALAQIESMTYLRNQLLRDSDWASMAHSVELRTPLVDAHLLKRLAPLLGQFRKFPNKTLLALAPAKPLPQEIITRRKTGFGIPVKAWIKESKHSTHRELIKTLWAKHLNFQAQ
jgi:asparagine synthase (glutamine-hydrolysing)